MSDLFSSMADDIIIRRKKANPIAGNGGAGSYGCGGAGGGAGFTNLAGAGGEGGDGLIIITAW